MAVDEIIKMAKVEWKVEKDLVYSPTKNELSFDAEKTYLGLPYTGGVASKRTLDEFLYHVKKGYYDGTVGNKNFPVGVDCAGGVIMPWYRFSTTLKSNGTENLFPYDSAYGILPVGDYKFRSKMTTDEIIALNSDQEMFQAYAQLKKGDAVNMRHTLDSTVAGHVRMVSNDVIVKYNSDGTINGYISFVDFIEQGPGNNDVRNDKGNTTWGFNRRYSFRKLLDDKYVPITIKELVENKYEEPAFNFNGKIEPETLETQLFKGAVESNYWIICVQAQALDASGNEVAEVSYFPQYGDRNKASISGVSSIQKKIKALPAGTYQFKLSVKCGMGEETLVEFTFTK